MFSSLEFLNVESNELSDLEVISVTHLSKLFEIGLSRNWISCEYATKFVQKWPNLKVIGDPCNQ